MKLYKLSWVLWIAGTVLVVGSWIGVVPVGLAWFGWWMALGGTILSLCCRRQVRCEKQVVQVYTSPADEVAKLDLLRREGVISDEEFQREKTRILSHR